MPTQYLDTPEGELEVWHSWWNGTETIHHRTALVSERRSFRFYSNHDFDLLARDGSTIPYRLKFGSILGWRLERAGETIPLKRPTHLVAWLFCLGLLVILLGATARIVSSLASGLGSDPLAIGTWPVEDIAELAGFLGSLPLAWWLRRRV